MKQTFTLLLATIFSASALTFIVNTPGSKLKQNNSNTSEAMEEGAGDRIRWEISRLADPSTGKIPDNIRQKELVFASTLPNDEQINSSRAISFTNRGPWNVGGRTRAFAIDISNENRLLAGSPSGGMWLSTDGGASWAMTTTSTQLKSASSIIQDKRAGHTSTWYCAGGEPYGASASGGGSGSSAFFYGDGLFKSTDGGASWLPVANTAGGNPNTFSTAWQLTWNVAMDVSAHDTIEEVYVAANGVIYRTVNGGTSWNVVCGDYSYYTDVNVSTTGVVYATLSSDGTQEGIKRSADGITFTTITPVGFPTTFRRIVSAINPSNENEVYFLANTPGFGKVTYNFQGDGEWNSLWKYTYLSGDGSGANGTWQDLSANLPASGGLFDKWNVQGSYDMVIKVKPNEPNTVFIGGTNLYRSTTGFQDSLNTKFIGGYQENAVFPVVNLYTNHHPDQHGVEFLPSDPDVMFSAHDGGISKTIDNTAYPMVWQSLNNGYITTMFYTVAIDHATPNNNIIVGGSQDNGTWYTNSASPTAPWVQPRGADGSYCAIADGQSAYYFSIQNGKMMKANLDANGTKINYARIDPIGLKKPLFINPYTLDPNNNNIMYLAGGKYLWRNNDLSGIPMVNNWDSISTNWTKFVDSVPTPGSVITAVHACKTPANRVYYGTDNKRVYKVENANTGTPTPVDITPTTGSAIFPVAGYVTCITTDPLDGNKVLVAVSNYNVYSLYSTTDGGVTWAKVAGNLEQFSNGLGMGPSVRWASILHVNDGTVFLLATSVGVYATDTLKGLSTTWVQQGTTTIGNSVCDMIDVRQTDGLVVIATHANGMYSANITSVNDIVSINDLRSSAKELQLINYPNPVSQSTTIEFSLDKKTNVTLQVLDESGRLVETLVNSLMSAGTHKVEYTTEKLHSGLYYYSIIVNDRRKTNKMLIVR